MTFEKINLNTSKYYQNHNFGNLTTSYFSSSGVFGVNNTNFIFPGGCNSFAPNTLNFNNFFGNLNLYMSKVPDFVGNFVKNAGLTKSSESFFNNFNINNYDMSNFYYQSQWNYPMDSFIRSSSGTSPTPLKTSITYKNGRIQIEGYNEAKGKELAEKILYNTNYKFDTNTRKISSTRKNSEEFTSNCARYVKRAIEDVGLGNYADGHACDMIAVLDGNQKFKKISSSNVDVTKLPAGCVLVYDKGVAGYSNEYGHIEVTLGDDRAGSDGITKNIKQNPTAIYVPV